MLKPPIDKITPETREKLLALAEFIEGDQEYGFWMQWITIVGKEVAQTAFSATLPTPAMSIGACEP